MHRFTVHSIEMNENFVPYVGDNVEDSIDEVNFLGNIQIPSGLINPIPAFRGEIQRLLGHETNRNTFDFEGSDTLILDAEGIPILRLRRLP